MKGLKFRKLSSTFKILILGSCLTSVLIQVNGLPQWVWNRDLIDSTRTVGNNNNQPYFVGQSSRYPISPSAELPKQSIRIVDGQQGRFFSNAISTVSNSLQNLGGGNSGGGSSNPLGGIFGAVLQTIPQLTTQAISGIFGGNRPVNLPAKDPGDTNFSPVSSVTGACKCVSLNECFLPSKPSGSCDGGRIKCCSTSRTVFPEDSESTKKDTRNDRTVRLRDVRRGLLQNILKGSGDVVDDTLDLLLTRYLSKEDQQRLATRVIEDGDGR